MGRPEFDARLRGTAKTYAICFATGVHGHIGATEGAVAVTEYVTSEEHLPDSVEEEVTLQITNKDTKEIFVTRARLARDPVDLSDPEPLTVVRGPHENVEEQWFIELLEPDVDEEGIDRELLKQSVKRTREESNVINARSDDLKALLLYLVAIDEHDSVSEAVREILTDHLAVEHPELLEAYVDVRAEFERDDIVDALRDA